MIDVISRALNPYTQNDEFMKLAEQPEMRFVISNTTEAGIAFDPVSYTHLDVYKRQEKRVVSPYSTRPAASSRVGSNPKPKYPMESSEKAIIIDFRKPILSAYAPVKIGTDYSQG